MPGRAACVCNERAYANQTVNAIEDMPAAPRCESLVEDDVVHLVPAFEALVVLVGTAANARAAWQRCVHVCLDHVWIGYICSHHTIEELV